MKGEFWVPVLTAALLLPAGRASRDPKADALLAKARRTAAAARTLQADAVETYKSGELKSDTRAAVRLMKPNFGCVTQSLPDRRSGAMTISDGKQIIEVWPAEKLYRKGEALPVGMYGLFVDRYAPLRAFFAPEILASGPEYEYVGTKQVDGQSYEVIQFTSRQSPQGSTRYFFAPNGRLEGMEVNTRENDRVGTLTFWLKNVRINAPMTPKDFAYAPPAEYRARPRAATVLLPVGTTVPDFRLHQPGGGSLSLSTARQGKKAVLINFWFYACGPCHEEFPRLQKMYEELNPKGLELIAVNVGDSQEIIQAYASQSKFTFKIAMGGGREQFTLGTPYNILAFPTNYLVDSSGKIVWRAVGFDEPALREELAKLGVQ